MVTKKRTRSTAKDLVDRERDPERLISECLRRKGRSLDLAGLGLTEVPEQVRALTWLERLDLQNNNITRLPAWIGELGQLIDLILWANPLQALPRALTNLQLLRQLVIDNDLPGIQKSRACRS